jgi:hypothetical protein
MSKNSFKSFFLERVISETAEPPLNSPVVSDETVVVDKWDVILFSGEYNPITKDEYSRICQFIDKFVGREKHQFGDNIDIGLVTDYDDGYENDISNKMTYDLTIEERNFISTKFFGLKLFPVNFEKMLHLIRDTETKSSNPEFMSEVNDMIVNFKENFHGSNILIVLRREDAKDIDKLEVISKVARGGLNIGFIIWDHDMESESKLFGRSIPINGSIIKAITLLDVERPNPEEIKAFAHKYKVQQWINEIKKIHFKVNNDRYIIAFRCVFPELNISQGADDSEVESNARVAMEMLKTMYLKNFIDTK